MRRLRIGRIADAAEPLRYHAAALPTFVIPLLALVAIAGYLVGHKHSSSASSSAVRTARTADVVFQYPRGWSRVSGGPQLDGLDLTQTTRLAPKGRSAQAGLLVGSLPAREPGPLTASFVAELKQLPQVAIVSLNEAQAYRYTRARPPGFAPALTLFVIPNPGGAATAFACYAPSAGSPYMRACEATVAGVTVIGQTLTYQLTPESRYAAGLSAVIVALDKLRVSLRSELQPQISAARAKQLAQGLAASFGDAGTALSKLEPNAPVERAQATLAAALTQARGGYEALAEAVAALSVPAYEAAQQRVASAEASVDNALENFALLGYIPAESAASNARS
jgi:hypothetical protein